MRCFGKNFGFAKKQAEIEHYIPRPFFIGKPGAMLSMTWKNATLVARCRRSSFLGGGGHSAGSP
jgi:hypothetical protein